MICFSFFTTQFFPPKQNGKKHNGKHNGKKEFPFQKNKTYFAATIKTISWECVLFYEKSFDVLLCTLKL